MSMSSNFSDTAPQRGRMWLRRGLTAGFIFVVFGALLALAFSLLAFIDAQTQQLTALEQRVQIIEVKNDWVSDIQWQEDKKTLNSQLGAQSKDLSLTSEKVSQIAERLDNLARYSSPSESDAKTEALVLKINRLEEHLTELGQIVQTLRQATASTVTAQPQSPKRRPTATPASAASAGLPFRLAAIEYRSGRTFAVLMPTAANQLRQIQLLTEGQQYQGWTVAQIQPDRVRLQRQGRTVTLRLP
ncbi:hypothetical protein AB7W12_09175 [Providencia rettgeri]